MPGEQAVIDRCFADAPLEVMLSRLDIVAASGSRFAAEAAAAMRRNAPLSMAIALEQLRRGAGSSFAETMRMEYRIVARVCRAPDFYEGVRALIIDKDQAPRWRPAILSGLEATAVAEYFAPLPDGELDLVGDSALGRLI